MDPLYVILSSMDAMEPGYVIVSLAMVGQPDVFVPFLVMKGEAKNYPVSAHVKINFEVVKLHNLPKQA